MFQCIIRGRFGRGKLTVHVEGCPRSGLPAIDYRRAHGIPESPSDTVELPDYTWTDEEFVRAAPSDRVQGSADLNTACVAGNQLLTRCNAVGELIEETKYTANGYEPTVGPAAVAAFLREQTPATGRALLLDLWAYADRSRAAALAEQAAHLDQKREEAQRIAEARALLADEIAKLTRQVAYWKEEAEAAQAALRKEREEEEADA